MLVLFKEILFSKMQIILSLVALAFGNFLR
jgi:hypothetical protein